MCLHVIMLLQHRIEKEKSQLKGELDDIHGQLEHVTKGKVSEVFLCFVTHIP
jgi:hypothetical protein